MAAVGSPASAAPTGASKAARRRAQFRRAQLRREERTRQLFTAAIHHTWAPDSFLPAGASPALALTVETLQADLAELRNLVTTLKAQITELRNTQDAPSPPIGTSPCTPPRRKERQQPLVVPTLPQCTGWQSLAIPNSIRRPWDVLQEDLEDKEEDARDHGKAAPSAVRDQQAAILIKGARHVFCELPRQERLAFTEVSLTELAAYTMWRGAHSKDEPTRAGSTLHTAWDLLSDDEKMQWVPDSPRTCLAADPFWAQLLETEPLPDLPSRRSDAASSCPAWTYCNGHWTSGPSWLSSQPSGSYHSWQPYTMWYS